MLAGLPFSIAQELDASAVNQQSAKAANAYFTLTLAKPRSAFWIVLLVAAYGGAIEILQPYVGRRRELSDAIANATGAFSGALLGVALNMFSAQAFAKARRDHDRQPIGCTYKTRVDAPELLRAALDSSDSEGSKLAVWLRQNIPI